MGSDLSLPFKYSSGIAPFDGIDRVADLIENLLLPGVFARPMPSRVVVPRWSQH